MFLRDANSGGGHFGVLTRFARDYLGTVEQKEDFSVFIWHVRTNHYWVVCRAFSQPRVLLSSRYFHAIRFRGTLAQTRNKKKVAPI